MADQQVFVTTIDQIPRGEGRMFRLGSEDIAIFHTHASEVFATQGHCPHLNGPLADGLTGGATVVCPLHDRVFDLRTGCGLSHENLQITTYPVQLRENGQIWMDAKANAMLEA